MCYNSTSHFDSHLNLFCNKQLTTYTKIAYDLHVGGTIGGSQEVVRKPSLLINPTSVFL